MNANPVTYFEIPVTDIQRAVSFYENVFQTELQRTEIDGHDMALFHFEENAFGASGALAQGESYVPSTSGPRLYFSVADINGILSRAEEAGGAIAYPITDVGEFWVAEFIDSEGNQIALTATKQANPSKTET